MKKRALLGVTLLTFTTLAGCTNLSEQKAAKNKQRLLKRRQLNLKSTSKNVIFMIGDGMGIRIQRAIAISKPITQTSVFPKQLLIPIWSDSKPLIQKMKKRMSPIQLPQQQRWRRVKPIIMLLHSIMTSPKQKQSLERAKKVGNQRGL